jgi:hypothetical protein
MEVFSGDRLGSKPMIERIHVVMSVLILAIVWVLTLFLPYKWPAPAYYYITSFYYLFLVYPWWFPIGSWFGARFGNRKTSLATVNHKKAVV